MHHQSEAFAAVALALRPDQLAHRRFEAAAVGSARRV